MVKLKSLKLMFVLVCWVITVQPSIGMSADGLAGPGNTIIAAVPRSFPPQYSVDDTGRPTGFAIDVMEAIAKIADIEVTYVTKETWREVQDALIKGDAHVIPNLGISAKRQQFAIFTAPLENFRISVFVKKNAQNLRTLDDISGSVIAAVDANVGARLVAARDDVEMKVFPNFQEALLALLSDRVQGLAYPEPVALKKANEAHLAEHIRVLDPPLKTIERAIAVRKDLVDLTTRLQAATDQFVTTSDYDNIYAKWYGQAQGFWSTQNLLWVVIALVVIVLVAAVMWRSVGRGGLETTSQGSMTPRLDAKRSASIRTIASKLLGIYVPMATIAVVVLFVILETLFFLKERDQLAASLNSLADVQSTPFQAAVWEYDYDQVRRLLGDYLLLPYFQGAAVYDLSGNVLGEVGDMTTVPEIPEFKVERTLQYSSNGVAEPVGRLVIIVHSAQIWERVIEHLQYNAIILLVLVASLVTSTLFAVRRVIGRPLEQLRYSIERTKTENVRHHVAWDSDDELGQVVRAYNEMQDKEEAATKELKNYQENLEDLVSARTSELAEATDQLTLAMDNMSNGLYVLDKDLNYVMSNTFYQLALELPDDLILPGKPVEQVVRFMTERGDYGPVENVDTHVSERLESLRVGKSVSVEIHPPSGRVLEFRNRRTLDGDTVVVFNDVTDAKRKEEELQRSSERFDLALKGGDMGSWDVNLETKETIVNERYLEMLGYTSENADNVRELWKASIHPDDRERVFAMGHDYRTGKLDTYEVEYRSLTKSGEERWLVSKGAAVERNARGEPIRMVGTVMDITDRKLAEQVIKEAEEQFRRILEDSPVAVAVSLDDGTTEDGIVQFANARFRDLFGLDENDIGKTRTETFLPEGEDRDKHQAALDARRSLSNVEQLVYGKDHRELWTLMSISPIEYQNRRSALIWFYDISDRKRMEVELMIAKEKAESATRAKSAFLAAMSHEIRTPMNGVVGMIDLLRETRLDTEQRQMMGTVRDSAFSLLQIINDILDFSKIEAGKLEIESVPISIRDVSEGVSETLIPNATAKHVRFVNFIDPAIPDWVMSDQVRLRQVLFNLLGNAIKFTETTDDHQGLVKLRAEVDGEIQDGVANIKFSIIDNGIGMSDDAVNTLFMPFTQAESSTTRRFGGTGLGLSICKSLTDIMGGEVGVSSVAGEGSTFTVTLPLKVNFDYNAPGDEPDLGGLHMLLVSNDELFDEHIPPYITGRGGSYDSVRELFDIEHAVTAAVDDGAPFDIVVFGVDCERTMIDMIINVLRQNEKAKDLRYVIITKDRKARKGMIVPDLVVVDAHPMKRSSFLRALGVASGRASPDIQDDHERLTKGAGKAPTPDEAAALGQLIMIAEDNPTNQDVIKRQLNSLGYAVEMYDDGKLGFEGWKSGRYALVLTDCHMPNMDGYEMTGAIREQEEASGGIDHVPIVAITANALQGEADRCLSAGMDDYLSKPLEMAKLKRALAKWMPVNEGAAAMPPSEEDMIEAPVTAVPPADEEGGAETEGVDSAIVDPTYLRETFGDDDDLINGILKDFVAPARDIVGELAMAYADQHPADLGAAAHKLKSSSRAVGAHTLADLCLELETAGKSGDWAAIENHYPKLAGVMDEVVDYIETL